MGFPLDLSSYTTPPFYSEDSTNSPGLGAILTGNMGLGGVPGMGSNADPGMVPGGAAPQAPNSYDKRRLALDTMQNPRAQAEAELANEGHGVPNWGTGKRIGVGVLATLAGAFSKGHGAQIGDMLNPNTRYQRKLSERIAEIAHDQQYIIAQQQERARIDTEQHTRELQDRDQAMQAETHAQQLQLGQQALTKNQAELAAQPGDAEQKRRLVEAQINKATAEAGRGTIKRTVSRPSGEVTNQAELDSWNTTNEGLKGQLASQTAELQKNIGRFKSKKEAMADPTVASLQSQIKATQDAMAQHGKARPKAVRGKTSETRTYTQEEADQIDSRLTRAQAIVDGTERPPPGHTVQEAQDFLDKYGTR